jgi:hypothetical protein
MALVKVRGTEYYMNSNLKKTWDKLRDGILAQKDDDRCYIVDGRERSGKSLFTIQQAAYIDETILDDGKDGTPLPRITFTAQETMKAIRETKSDKTHTKVIIFDEAFRGMSSRGTLSKENKMLAQGVQEMGQNNVVLFIVSPRFFMLELYVAVLRSHALFHIVKAKNDKKRMVKVYSEKKKGLLYQLGMRKGWAYKVKTQFKDWFFNKWPGGDEFEKRYRAKKLQSLQTMGLNEGVQPTEEGKYYQQRNLIIAGLYNHLIKSQMKLSKWLTMVGVPLSQVQVHDIMVKSRKNSEKAIANKVYI